MSQETGHTTYKGERDQGGRGPRGREAETREAGRQAPAGAVIKQAPDMRNNEAFAKKPAAHLQSRISCVAGYTNASSLACSPCGLDTFKTALGNFSCAGCPENTQTLGTGAPCAQVMES